jgi:hypothetical protein
MIPAAAVWAAPSFTQQPAPQSILVGQSTVFAAAAIHTGLLAAGERGTVQLKFRGPQTQYTASTRNGVSSSGYGAWPGSFELLGRAPFITRHPVSQARMVGATAEFQVTVEGAASVGKDWQVD